MTAAPAPANALWIRRRLCWIKVFPRLAMQMIQVGEESGELDSLLLKVADTFEVETRNTLDRLLTLLVPALTIFMAAIVAAIILSVLLPIYDLTGNLG